MTTLYSYGLGIGAQNNKGEWLDVYYPQPVLGGSQQLAEIFRACLGYQQGNQALTLTEASLSQLADALEQVSEHSQAKLARSLSKSTRPIVATLLATDDTPTSLPEAYLKLHLLSHRLVKPHGTKLDGMFSVLPNTAWTSEGAIDLDELSERQLQARLEGRTLSVDSIDKFPKMTDYVVPSGVRIADTARVRLGAYIGEGTTIMHEGFINFNAGADGPGMIEGRISSGVFVGAGSDLGGGSSTMGTLSGGGNVVISLGKECLLGANAGTGISLGDRCTVESGLYVTAGTKVTLLDDNNQAAGNVRARELSGKSDLLFRRNSLTGAVECLTNQSAIALNEALHVHN